MSIGRIGGFDHTVFATRGRFKVGVVVEGTTKAGKRGRGVEKSENFKKEDRQR